MSVAYYIVLNNENPGFDTFVNGKALAKEASRLDPICDRLGLPRLDSFVAMSGDDAADLLGEDLGLPESWFSAEEGLKLVESLSGHIRNHPKDLKDPRAVLDDLAEFADVLGKAKEIGAAWHLSIDI
ncbi:MAG: hypothetical protein AB1646_05165 [Thermodesulfobacteriota bacterium]